MAKSNSKQIEAMRKQGFTEEEIAEMLADDEDIDKGVKKDWDLSDEEHKKAMKNANADEHRKPLKLEQKPRPRKEDSVKRTIINAIQEFLCENSHFSPENVAITNPEQKVSFEFEGENYTISLTRHRKPKD
jgi:DNA-binding transcriptional MerR regulator